jgi:nitroreductase
MNEVLKAIKERRSVRAYTNEQISQEALDLILEAGIYAPTAHNEQPWYFTVVQKPQLLDEMNMKSNEVMAQSENDWLKGLGTNPAFRASYNAPTVIIISAREDAMSIQTDCAAAAENMMLAAQSLGIGSVWVGLLWPYLSLAEAKTSLQLPDGYKPVHAIAFGYPSGPKLPTPPRKKDVVTYIK